MTNEQLSLILSRNPQLTAHDPGTAPKLERTPRNAPLETRQAEKGNPGRIHLRIVSVRKRLIDPDNLSPKWSIDCLRYCKIIPGDEPDKITLEVSQRKAQKHEEERTEIEIFFPG